MFFRFHSPWVIMNSSDRLVMTELFLAVPSFKELAEETEENCPTNVHQLSEKTTLSLHLCYCRSSWRRR